MDGWDGAVLTWQSIGDELDRLGALFKAWAEHFFRQIFAISFLRAYSDLQRLSPIFTSSS